MKLLKSITVLFFILGTTIASAQWGKSKRIKGDGNIITTTVSTNSYDEITTSGAMDFKLIPGKENGITIKGDSNLMAYIITEVANNILVVKVKDGYNINPSKTIVITIPYESIRSVSLAGSGDLENSGIIKSDHLKVSLAGSGDMDLKIDSQSIESNIAGSGDIELEGSTTNLTVKITGSGDFDGKALQSTNVTAKVTGSGSANVVCNGELIARVTGSGDVTYSGKPTHKDSKVTGSGSVSN